jgi:predicted site-specific integrase-resolvase
MGTPTATDEASRDKEKAAGRLTVLYCRVSTVDQTLDHQWTQAKAAGFQLDEVVADHGVSGVSIALRDRPQRDGGLPICSAPETLLLSAGWIGLAETTGT